MGDDEDEVRVDTNLTVCDISDTHARCVRIPERRVRQTYTEGSDTPEVSEDHWVRITFDADGIDIEGDPVPDDTPIEGLRALGAGHHSWSAVFPPEEEPEETPP